MTYFSGKENFISVAIGPMCYDSRYAHLSNEPDPCLSGDYKFIAKQMGLKYPLLHVGSSQEIKIFNDHMMNNPSSSTSNLEELARLFKEKSDGIKIFPKLPSMLKVYFKTCEKNSGIKSTEQALDSSVNDPLLDFFDTRFCLNTGIILPPTKTILQQESADIHIDFTNTETNEEEAVLSVPFTHVAS